MKLTFEFELQLEKVRQFLAQFATSKVQAARLKSLADCPRRLVPVNRNAAAVSAHCIGVRESEVIKIIDFVVAHFIRNA